MIPVKVAHVFLSNVGFVVLLRGEGDNRTLPIFIGAQEAQSILIVLNKVQIPRPLTHDLFKNVLDFLECRLIRVEVCDLREGTFYARMIVENNAQVSEIDARPSDAISLALRFGTPVYVDGKVMDEAGVVLPENAKPEEHVAPAKEATAKEQEAPQALTPLEALKNDLRKAISEERYEDAAALRDKIKEMTSSN